jgi:TonB family protein
MRILTCARLASLLTLAAAAGGPVAAQAPDSTWTIVGTVRNPDGLGISGAELVIPGTAALSARTDLSGGFRIVGTRAGTVSLSVRRLGFSPVTTEVAVRPGETTETSVTLERAPQELAAVVVQAQQVRRGRLGDYDRRRKLGFGHFISRDEIERRNPLLVTDLLRTVPGVRLQPGGFAGRYIVRMRAARCDPLVWLDGSPLSAGYFDVDALVPQSIEAMEVYTGPSTVPAQFMDPRGISSCGVIVVWTREGEPSRNRKRDPATAAKLAEAVAAASLYTADQVEVPVRVDSTRPVLPIYPESLFVARVSGVTDVEFVVDTAGKVEPETFGVVSSSHPLFTEAVRRAVRMAGFQPAMLRGRPVRQVVLLPVRFAPPESPQGRQGQPTSGDPPPGPGA